MSIFGFPSAITTHGHFGTGFANFGVSEVVAPEVCDPCADIAVLTSLINQINISLGNTLNSILETSNDNSARIKLIQGDMDKLKKRTKYWEDRNLLKQTKDQKVGRSGFRNSRQGLGGDD